MPAAGIATGCHRATGGLGIQGTAVAILTSLRAPAKERHAPPVKWRVLRPR